MREICFRYNYFVTIGKTSARPFGVLSSVMNGVEVEFAS